MWLVSVLAATGAGQPVPIDAALRQERGGRTLVAEWDRLGRAFPAIARSTGPRRGQLALTQDQAWELMTTTGPMLAAVGFDVRVPTMSTPQGDADARGCSPSRRTRWSAPTSSAT